MSDSLYTPEVAHLIRNHGWPSGLVFDVTEEYDPEQFLRIIFYRDNWLTLTGEDQLFTVNKVKELMSKLWPNVPTYVGKMENVSPK